MNEREIFDRAIEIEDADERAAFLQEACSGDAELRAGVERLLAEHARTSEFVLDEPVVEPQQTIDMPAATADYLTGAEPGAVPETVIAGRYTLEQKIGEGGMGEVWVAEQTEPVKRRVALKLIKAGMDSKAVLARFEQERQALAMMDHPNIARVLDGGLTPTRQPFFVMELVNGLPLTNFCDEAKLSVRERLELFVPICQAVQHAHQKGIVHRDLKPSNILVTIIDGRPVPRVIDFGVAKAVSGKLTDESLSTQFGSVVGTLEYMSPEQAGFSGVDVDTRADIYSLGVILYELLTGLRPIDASRLREAALTEMIRIIQEEDPSKPSTRLSTDQSLPSLAALRQIEPKKLTALLRGELDWVVMKCLEKQRDRRYETVNALARDVQRYLADEPVEARPPSAGYRLKKFLRRNRGPVAAASLVFLALVGGIAGTTWGLFEARRQQRIASNEAAAKEEARRGEAERAESERLARQRAQQRLSQVEKGNEILASIFENLDPDEIAQAQRPLQAILVEKLDGAVQQLEGEAIGDPHVVAAMQRRLGKSLLALGEPAKAIVVHRRAHETLLELLGPDDPATLQSSQELAAAHGRAGEFDVALSMLEESLERTRATLGTGHRDTITAMANVAAAYFQAGKLHQALALWEQSLNRFTSALGPDHPDTLAIMKNLAIGYHRSRQLDKAVSLSEEFLKRSKATLGPGHSSTLEVKSTLAGAYLVDGKANLAVPLLEDVLKIKRETLGPDHMKTLNSMNALATVYQEIGKLSAAERLYKDALDRLREKLGPDHPDTLNTVNNLGSLYWMTKQLDKSIPVFEELVEHRKAKLGETHPETVRAMANLGINYRDAGRLEEALPLLEAGYQTSKRYPPMRWAGPQLLEAYARAGKSEQAAALVVELLSDLRTQLPGESLQLAGVFASLGSSLLEAKAFADAEPLLRECLTIREKQLPDSWLTFNTQSMLGGALLGQKKYAEAEPLLLKGYEGMKRREKTIPPQGKVRLVEAVERLVQLYEATDGQDELSKWHKELAAIRPAPNAKK